MKISQQLSTLYRNLLNVNLPCANGYFLGFPQDILFLLGLAGLLLVVLLLLSENQKLARRIRERTYKNIGIEWWDLTLNELISSWDQITGDLAQNMALCSAILESTAEGILVVNREGNITYYNQYFLKIWSLQEDLMKTQKGISIINTILGKISNPQSMISHLPRLYKTQMTPCSEQIKLKNSKFIEICYYPQIIEEKTVGIVMIFRDITADQQTELALRQSHETNRTILKSLPDLLLKVYRALEKSEEQYRRIVETSLEGVWIIDPENKTVFANQRMADILGYSLEEMLNHSLFEFMDVEGHAIAQNYIERCQKGIEERHDFKFKRKDGSDLWAILSSNPIFDTEGQYAGALGMITDITERKRSEEALSKSEATNRALLNAIPDAMFRLSKDGTFLDIKVAKDFELMWPASPLLAKTIKEVFPKELAEKSIFYIQLALQTKEVQSFEAQLSCPLLETCIPGNLGYFEARIIAISQEEVLMIVRDITKRKKAEEMIRYQANYDLLTGLPNRMLFNERLSLSLTQSRQHQKKLAVCFLDIDHFKKINDTLGHSAGDLLLKNFASRVSQCVRKGDTVARWAGDEFTLIIPEIELTDDVANIAQRILDVLKNPFDLDGNQLHISSSIGIAIYPDDGECAETLIKNADAALYRVKEKGRNNYQFYNSTIHVHAGELLTLANSLHHGIEKNELEIFYQPIVNIKSWEITGMEALLRWQHPTLGLVSPDTFIPLAEENDLIIPLGEWILKTACHQSQIWHDLCGYNLRISVNLSATEFLQPNLVPMVTHCLETTGLHPQFLELEVTESTCLKDIEKTRQLFHEFRSMGVRIAMDDFGTGYSSLCYLKSLPFDVLKLHQSFFQDVMIDSEEQAIATTIITLAHCLNLSVIAQGVETQEQLEFLSRLNCDEIQGYLFSRPLSAEKASKLLKMSRSNVVKLFHNEKQWLVKDYETSISRR
jgi:diguanylate cyclase (GGDEF)-like protein/PAS domain S-box-containing protein